MRCGMVRVALCDVGRRRDDVDAGPGRIVGGARIPGDSQRVAEGCGWLVRVVWRKDRAGKTRREGHGIGRRLGKVDGRPWRRCRVGEPRGT